MSKIPDYLIDEIKEKISITEIVSEYVTLTKKGGRFWGLCPFHNEKTPSFTVNEDKGFFHCFGCGKGGSVFNFLMDMEHLNFVEAAHILAEKAGITIEQESPEQERKRSEKQLMYELYNRLAESFHYILLHKEEASHARAYLKARKISDDIVQKFILGYAPADPDWLYRFLKKRKYSDEFLAHSGVFSKNNSKYPVFRDRLIFPISDQSGNVMAFGGRALDDASKAKYLNTAETIIFHKRKTLFGLHQSLPEIKKSNTFTICEGYFDVLAMHQAGESNTVAPLGTAFTEDQCLKLGRYAKNCNLLFDSDHAGKEATKKAIYILEKMGIKSRVIQIDGKDPADILQNSSIDLLKKIHKKGINSFTYMIEEAKKQFDYKIPEGKLSIFNEVWPYLEIIQSDIKLSSSIKTLAEEIDVDEKIIVSEMRKMQNRSTSSDRHERVSAQRVEKSLELYIMLVVVNNRELFIDVRRHIRLDDLEDVRAKEIYTALEESLREGETSFENLLNRIEQDEIKTLIRENYGSEEYMMHVESLIADLLKRYRLRKLERQRKSIENRIKMLEKSGDLDIKGMQDLLYEKKFIDEEIGKIRNL